MAKVMVVDDAQADLQLMASMLRSAGHQVLLYSQGERVEETVVSERPDLLLLDIVMPGRNGYDVLRALKKDERTKRTPVVVVSSKNQESDHAWGRRQGADDYLGKPFTREQLLAAVGRFVG
ncbi:MAG: PleD family two-component system response regulator [Candidatus Methylomirabilales bacterium]